MINRAERWQQVDFDAYMLGDYTPPPELCRLPDADFILSGWGGKGFGLPVARGVLR